MNIRTRMMYKAIFLWERRGWLWGRDGRWEKHEEEKIKKTD